jgi:hypothetical protein
MQSVRDLNKLDDSSSFRRFDKPAGGLLKALNKAAENKKGGNIL